MVGQILSHHTEVWTLRRDVSSMEEVYYYTGSISGSHIRSRRSLRGHDDRRVCRYILVRLFVLDESGVQRNESRISMRDRDRYVRGFESARAGYTSSLILTPALREEREKEREINIITKSAADVNGISAAVAYGQMNRAYARRTLSVSFGKELKDFILSRIPFSARAIAATGIMPMPMEIPLIWRGTAISIRFNLNIGVDIKVCHPPDCGPLPFEYHATSTTRPSANLIRMISIPTFWKPNISSSLGTSFLWFPASITSGNRHGNAYPDLASRAACITAGRRNASRKA